MQNFLFELHSGWRYIVVLSTLSTAAYFGFMLYRGRSNDASETRLLRVWPVLIDIQIALGILLVVVKQTEQSRWYYDSFTGHWLTMVIAALVAHGATIFRKLNGEPSTKIRQIMGLTLPLIVSVLVFIGLQAINRGLLERTG